MGDGEAARVPLLQRRVLVGILAALITALLIVTELWRVVHARGPLPPGAMLVAAPLQTPAPIDRR